MYSATLAASEAQMGRGCGEGNPGGTAELDEDLLMEEEWLVALKGALAPRPLRLGEAGSRPKDRQRATKAAQGFLDQEGPEEARASPGEGDSSPHQSRGRCPGVCLRGEA